MKFFATVASALLFISAAAALPADSVDSAERPGRERPQREGATHPHVGCVSPSRAVPFYRAFNSQKMDHMYSTNKNEIDSLSRAGYQSQGIAGFVFASLQSNTVPLFRLYNPTTIDHVFTTSEKEREDKKQQGWKDEGTAAFVYSSDICNSRPMFRLVLSSAGDHMFTKSTKERDDAERKGYRSEGVAGYILESNH